MRVHLYLRILVERSQGWAIKTSACRRRVGASDLILQVLQQDRQRGREIIAACGQTGFDVEWKAEAD